MNEISENNPNVRILICEQTAGFSASCIRELQNEALATRSDVVGAAGDFMNRIASDGHYDVIITEARLADWSALETIHWIDAKGYEIPVILIADGSRDEFVTSCMRAGAADYVLKNELARLPIVVRRVLNERNLRMDRDRAESELRDSEERYRLLFESNPNPMWVCDVETLRFLAVNGAAVRQYGYSRREFLNMTISDLCPEEVPFFYRSIAAGDLHQDCLRGEVWKHYKKNGVGIEVEISSEPIVFRGQQAMLVLAHDVTAILRVEHALSKSREQLQSLLDSTAEGIFGVDLRGVCTFCNAAAARMLGYDSASTLVGMDVHFLVHNASGACASRTLECSLSRILNRGSAAYGTEDQFQRFDGDNLSVEYWCHPVVREGEVTGTVLTFFDVTERKKAEEALRRTEAQYTSIIQRAPYGIYRTDSTDRLLMANPALVAMLGYDTEEELLGLGYAAAFYRHPEESVCRETKYSWVGDAFEGDSTLVRKDASHVTVRLKARQFHSESGEHGYEVFVEDITEKHHLERQLLQSQKMEAIGQLAGGVAHDFNNLLMVVNSFAELILKESYDEAKVRNYTGQIYDAGSKAAAVTRQLLAFSRAQVQDLKVLDLNEVVADWRKVLPRLLGESVKMIFSPSALPVLAEVDRGQMEQVIMNLVINARDAMPAGGTVTITTEHVYLDQAYFGVHDVSIASGAYVMLSVADTGVGMDAATRTRVFEPFFTTKGRDKGTGLGLSTVYGIVKQSRGLVWVYSELGHGSVFKVYLPEAQRSAQPALECQDDQAEPRGSETILVVDDEPGVREVSAEYLRNQGYTVFEASGPRQALSILRQEPAIHLVLTDMMMADGTGPELANAIKETGRSLQVVFMSGYADHSVKRESFAEEHIYLQKPFSMRKLALAVRSALERTAQ
jgi:two-component system, cell cycle sensor histidine kinase and response regulator CckA